MKTPSPTSARRGLWTFLCMALMATAAWADAITIKTPGLSISFDENALPISLKNAKGKELLGPETKGFFLREYDKQERRFNTVEKVGENELLFGFNKTPEKLGVKISGANRYMTFEFTKIEGYPFKGETIMFQLMGQQDHALIAQSLDYMVFDQWRFDQHSYPLVTRNSHWEVSSHNPLGRFAVYERVSDELEDETLFDLWVDEGLPHPQVEGKWDRKKASAWVDAWIEKFFDTSMLGITPSSHEDLRKFLPYAKLMDAKFFYINFRYWRGNTIDGVNKKYFPKGLEDFLAFKEDAEKEGVKLMTHRMSGGLWPSDPDYVADHPHPGLDTWGSMSLAKPFVPGDKTILVHPDEDLAFPQPWKGRVARPPYPYPVIAKGIKKLSTFRVGDMWVTANSFKDLGNGTWELTNLNLSQLKTKAHKKAIPTGTVVMGYFRGNIFFIPGPNTELMKEVAERYAGITKKLFNDAHFDGAAWHMFRGQWGWEKFASIIYQNLNFPTVCETSHGLPGWAWLEYRFNRVKKAFGGKFKTKGGSQLFFGHDSRATPPIENIESDIIRDLADNNRCFGLSHDMTQSIDMFERVGHVKEVLTTIKDFKKASLAMDPEQRQYMAKTSLFKSKDRMKDSNRPVGSCLWRIDGSVFRRWFCASTEEYTNMYYYGQEHGTIPPRFYHQNGQNLKLKVPEELQKGVDQTRVIGRVLPMFDPKSPHNVDLMKRMELKGDLTVSGHNPDHSQRSWDEARLKKYPIRKINLEGKKALGIRVVGDGSGATLVVRLDTHDLGRDYAFPIDFNGERWLEVPTGEQGWRLENWQWVRHTKKMIDFSKIDTVHVGLGYLPPNTKSEVVIKEIVALHEINEPLVDPTFSVGDQTIQVQGSINPYDQFILDPDGSFKIYDEDWYLLGAQDVGAFRPSHLKTFRIHSEKSPRGIWIEAIVQGTNESIANPGKSSTVIRKGGQGKWNDPKFWDRGSVPSEEDNVVVGHRSVVTDASPTYNILRIKPGSSLAMKGSVTLFKQVYINGTLEVPGALTFSKGSISVGGTLGASTETLKLDGGEIGFLDGSKMANGNMSVELPQRKTELTFTLSPTGFSTLKAGSLVGRSWENLHIKVDISEYNVKHGDNIVLMDFAQHDKALSKLNAKTLVMVKEVITNGEKSLRDKKNSPYGKFLKAKGQLIFDATTSSLVLDLSSPAER